MQTAAFIAALGGLTFIRAIWPEKQRGDVPSGFKAAYSHYGAYTETTEKQLRRLNEHGYSIFYGANDPGIARLRDPDIDSLRLIYRDCDTSEELVEICGRKPHFHILTSPGKSQSIWLTYDLPVAWQGRIHSYMANSFGHDPSTHGAARLLRLPGFANTKYEPAVPVVVAIEDPEAPRLTMAAVEDFFALQEPRMSGNIMGAAVRAQSGSGACATVYNIRQERVKRGRRDEEAERQQRAKAFDRTGVEFAKTILLPLCALDPDCGRADWLRIGAALHFLSDGSDWGLDTFDTWSQLGDKYTPRGPNSPSNLWRGFSSNRERVSHLGTLEYMARLTTVDARAKSRLNSPLIRKLEERVPETVEIQRLATEWPDISMDGESPTPTRDSIFNAYRHIQTQEPSVHLDDFQATVSTSRGKWTEQDTVALWASAREAGWKPDKGFLELSLQSYAQKNRKNPLTEHFESLPVWDRVERLSTAFIRHLGAPDSAYMRELTQLIFVAIVKRAYEPGCKFDLLPVFEGRQGLGKSSLFKRLAPRPEWHTESPRLDLEEKRFYPMIHGKLIVEFAEMRGKKGVEIERIKALISQTTDSYIGNYARHETTLKRVAVFVGTTNDSRYLRDMSGNRRFPIIPINHELDYDAIDMERDQLWAEALFLSELYGRDDLRLSKSAMEGMQEIQRSRLDYDPGAEEVVDTLLDIGGGFLSNDVLWEALGLPEEKRGTRLQGYARHTITQIRDSLRFHGWDETKNPVRIRGRRLRGLYKRDLIDEVPELCYNPQTRSIVRYRDMDHFEDITDV